MTTQPRTNRIGTSKPRRTFSLIILVLNLVLIVCTAVFIWRYMSVYRVRLQEENLGNIKNLNQSAAGNATAMIDSLGIKLDDLAQYFTRHPATRDEALLFLEDANSSDTRQFELIGSDYTGYLARRGDDGAFVPLSYAGSSYAVLQTAFDDTADVAFDDVCFAPEFTDGSTALKYFAVYRHIPLKSAQGAQESHTLLLAVKSTAVLKVFNSQNDFEGQSSVLMDPSGNYIVSNADFKSTNFFQYLYVYNDLTLDQRNAIAQEMGARDRGELYYKNAAGQDCVFSYVRMATNGWYCITCVPLSSFRTSASSISYLIYAALALFIMLLLDLLWLRGMNRRLRVSMQHEKEASDAKTDFLSRMSHDIRTPLNGVIGLTALAMEETNPPRTQEYLENINVSGKFLLGLVNDILDMSKVERGLVELHPEPYSDADLHQYVDAVVTPLCLDKGQTFTVIPPSECQSVMLDRLRFNQIVFNLLSNAVKYTPSGGTVTLSWTRTPVSDTRVVLALTVRDTGIGMSEAFQAHMFEAFAQEHAETANAGTGLGLAIVHSLVQLMGGTVTADSTLHQGTAFTVRLEADACQSAKEQKTALHEPTLSGKRVLLCEDNKVNILVAVRLLEKWGVDVDVALNGQEGLDMFASSALHTYNAVLMDVMMPQMNGMDATRAIRLLDRADAQSVPIIAMTANAYDTDVERCLAAGMTAHMGKPIDPHLMHALLQRLL